MTEERYLKITSCKECPHYGHTYSKFKKNITIFICGYPENVLIEQLPAVIVNKIAYPITYEGEAKEFPIPKWCKLTNIAYYQKNINSPKKKKDTMNY